MATSCSRVDFASFKMTTSLLQAARWSLPTIQKFAMRRPDDPFCIEDTAERGITLGQLQLLVTFVSKMASSWCETFGQRAGSCLDFHGFNLYHANHWIIKPATAGYYGTGCSLVEIMATQLQLPHWFVSHAWIENLCANSWRVWSSMLGCGNCLTVLPIGCAPMPTTSTV
ncbi:unnamed protein product [Effrenium voratum]|uniref:Uncharacterized protein n=1 Tax=Effrenium voratum TaxID=2562239 RepID=A0AA36HPL5_9DINO|nr:unnamed protein product [Effrenium voratum]